MICRARGCATSGSNNSPIATSSSLYLCGIRHIYILQDGDARCMPDNAARIHLIAIAFADNICLRGPEILYTSVADLAKESRTVDIGDIKILHTKEITVELAGKCTGCTISSDRSMCCAPKVNILLKHIVARERCGVRIDRIQLGFILNELIVFGIDTHSVDGIVRGSCCCTIADMGIAAIGIGGTRCGRCSIHINGAESPAARLHIRRIQEADMRAVHLD